MTFPLSVGSVAWPTWMYFPLEVPEYLGKKKDADGYELWLRDLLEGALGKVAAAGIAISFPELENETVCRVDVPSASQPVFANRPKAERTDEFYLRSGNSTRKLTPFVYGSDAPSVAKVIQMPP